MNKTTCIYNLLKSLVLPCKCRCRVKYQEELFAGLPIIFSGVNNIDTALEQNANPKVTEVVEAVSMLDTLRLIKHKVRDLIL
ncbi:MAG: hypothetical protein GY749_42455 [Desulfobacteraceae bacterium]|nr:hypothetical protein [Desulfobacteraceae bacterium]